MIRLYHNRRVHIQCLYPDARGSGLPGAWAPGQSRPSPCGQSPLVFVPISGMTDESASQAADPVGPGRGPPPTVPDRSRRGVVPACAGAVSRMGRAASRG